MEDESNYELVALSDQPEKAIRLKRALKSGCGSGSGSGGSGSGGSGSGGSGSGKDNIRLNVCMHVSHFRRCVNTVKRPPTRSERKPSKITVSNKLLR